MTAFRIRIFLPEHPTRRRQTDLNLVSSAKAAFRSSHPSARLWYRRALRAASALRVSSVHSGLICVKKICSPLLSQQNKMLGMLAGAPGFEPGNGGTKNRCLTTWLRPNAGGPFIIVCVAVRKAGSCCFPQMIAHIRGKPACSHVCSGLSRLNATFHGRPPDPRTCRIARP